MFTLKVLGGAALEGPEGPLVGRPAQKRRLALLALLAMSRTNRLAREKLIAHLWPDRDPDGARHLLSDAVYVLNRALGSEALSSVGDELRLNPDRVSCDARTFEEAVAAARMEEAVRLYTGPLLDGFFLDGSDEFEAWMSRERDRLYALFASALERLAFEREAGGDVRGSIEAWRRLAAEDPYNSRLAVQLAQALERSGDHGGALQSAQAHAAFLRQELGLQPPSDLRELITSLKRPAEKPEPPAAAEAEPQELPETGSAPAGEPAAAPIAAQGLPVTPAGERTARNRSHVWWATAAVTAAAVLVAWLNGWPSAGTATALRSVAVMPFEEVGADTAGQYLGEGIADELTTTLGQSTSLRVAGRTSAFAFKGRGMDARGIGRALGVDALLEGSVRHREDRLRIAVRLVNVRDGYQIWSETWDRPLGDMPRVQEQIAAAVLRVLDGGTARDGAAVPSVPPAAYHLYLQGRYLWHQRTRDSLMRAADSFERAIAEAPAYPQAHSGLADAYAVMGFYDYLRPADAFPRAKLAAQRAVVLDPDLAQAHASLAYVALYYDWNWAEAEAAFARAIALNPSYSVAHQWYGNYLTARGRFDEALAAMRRAQEVDPLSLIASAAAGWVQFYSRDYDGAVEQCRRTLELNPDFELAHLWAGWADEAAGRYDTAIERLTTAVRLSANGAVALASLGRAQALSGAAADARATLAQLQRLHQGYLPAYELAKLHLALGEQAVAMAWLRRAHAERSHSMVFLAVDPQLDGLREDPEFIQLTASLGTEP